jgi:hypothetical protein
MVGQCLLMATVLEALQQVNNFLSEFAQVDVRLLSDDELSENLIGMNELGKALDAFDLVLAEAIAERAIQVPGAGTPATSK